ncbi:mannosyltransferase [Polychytrium aggregatum]|uniref:mannosyltransferase n=1 Tax=Polychytrium aggregatum TaxID=110093 RepID=UPI0022FF431E|nr:mannosyltransferase [Polychytrium aggregatum]KAI9204821.1 mannosyltransferase [Polychytrium aggregatum]
MAMSSAATPVEIYILSAFVAFLIVAVSSLVRFRSSIQQSILSSRSRFLASLPSHHGSSTSFIIGFFHPYADMGGGGERVLWSAIQAIQAKYPTAIVVVYAWDRIGEKDQVLVKVKSHFNLAIDSDRLHFIKLKDWIWLEARKYKRLTMVGQSLGSIWVVWEALGALAPDIFVDSIGCAFTFPIVKLFGASVVAYVHYPTVSSDMLQKVASRVADYNNKGSISSNPIKSFAKLWYYRVFAVVYAGMGLFADVIMVNSTWTYNHIVSIWRRPKSTTIVYPPCNTERLLAIPLSRPRQRTILSVAQFRPEKAHMLQLEAFKLFLTENPEYREGVNSAQLVLLGGSRNDEDQKRVQELESAIKVLGLQGNAQIIVNASHEVLGQYLSQSMIGLHTMYNEHFGIGVVEYMAAGLIPLVHKSGGPMMDIVVPFENGPTGFLAETEEEFAAGFKAIFAMSTAEQSQMRERARKSVSRFSDQIFKDSFIQQISPVCQKYCAKP